MIKITNVKKEFNADTKIHMKDVKFEDGKIKVSETAVHSAFVPPCTRQVFLKYFSPIAGNMNYWTKEDAKNYLKEMKITLADFFPNDNQGGQ